MMIFSGLMMAAVGMAQNTGTLQGTLFDGDKEGMPFASVALLQNGAEIQIATTQTDFDGNYVFSNILAGTYDLKAHYVGYATTKIIGITILSSQVTKVNVLFDSVTTFGDSSIVVRNPSPLLDNTLEGQILTAEDIKKLRIRNVSSIAGNPAGVNQKDKGKRINFNSSRNAKRLICVPRVIKNQKGVKHRAYALKGNPKT